jgi:hypothetical protein
MSSKPTAILANSCKEASFYRDRDLDVEKRLALIRAAGKHQGER